MNSSFIFLPKMRAVFGEAGKRACRFEAKQIVWVLLLVFPTLEVLFLLMVYEPFVKEVPLDSEGIEEEGTLVTAIDPVGFNTVVWTGSLISAMMCSWTSHNFGKRVPPCNNIVLLSSIAGIGTVMYFTMHSITTELGFKVPFLFLDILCSVFLYFLWLGVKHKVAGNLELKHPRKSNLITATHKKKAAKESHDNLLVSTLLPISLITVYMLVLIPTFASASPPVQFLLRCVGHTWIKGQQDMRQRDAFANGNFSQTVKVRLYDNVRDGSGLLAAWKVPRLFFGEQLDGARTLRPS